ncbi:type IV pilus assembly protein PilM [Candidatus Dojkabacteria bacterium]|nr:type IV pilus assembly protein PilM [Candidatus Dojkabacteria bacterium]
MILLIIIYSAALMASLPDHIGLDFGNHSVKAVQLRDISRNPSLVAFASQPTPIGVINSEDESHQAQLADALRVLYEDGGFRTRNVVAALPEFSIFTRFLEFPGVKESELEDAIHWQAKQVVPIPMSEIQMSWILLGRDESKNAYRVLLVAAPRKLIDLYVKIVQMAKLDLVAIETEAIAAGRSVYRSANVSDAVILDLGSQSTDMGIMVGGELLFSQSIAVGSDSLTRAIASEFSFEYNQAEEYKRNYGIDPSQLEGKIYQVLKPVVDSVIAEIRRGIEFFKTRTLKSAPDQFLLIGDGSLLPGLVVYLSQELMANVQLADPWNGIKIDKKQEAILSKGRSAYAVAVGLALKAE